MKKTTFFTIVFFSIMLAPSFNYAADSNDDWYNMPIVNKNGTSSGSTTNVQDDFLLKKPISWYKKPSTKYAAGAIVAMAVTAYALMEYLRGTDAVAISEQQDNNTKVREGSSSDNTDENSSEDGSEVQAEEPNDNESNVIDELHQKAGWTNKQVLLTTVSGVVATAGIILGSAIYHVGYVATKAALGF